MSQARDRITRALRLRGWRVVELEWSPLGAEVEMQGPSGGWVVQAEPSPEYEWPANLSGNVDFMPGMNVAQVLEQIAYLPDLTGKQTP